MIGVEPRSANKTSFILQLFFEKVSVVIVTFNSGHVLPRALGSIPTGCETIIVDNASIDDTSEVSHRFGARYIQNEKNLGFGTACNIGAAASDREYILFLNPDAVLKGRALTTLLEALTAHPDASAAGPKLITESGKSVWRHRSVLHPQKKPSQPTLEPEGICCVPLLTGAAILCRRNIFKTIGGFDENIFMYFEDDDLSRRLVDAGGYLIYQPDAKVLHDFGNSSGQSFELIRMRNSKKIQSQVFVMKKYAYAVDLRKIQMKAIQRLVFSIVRFDVRRIAASLGTLDGLREIRHPVIEATDQIIVSGYSNKHMHR